MFDNLEVVSIEPTASKKKSSTPEIALPGMKIVAALKMVGDEIASLQKTHTEALKQDAINTYFLKEGLATGRTPVNFRGTDGEAHGSVQLRAKTSASALTPDEVAVLDEHGIPTQTIEIGIEAIIINPDYVNDPKVLAAMKAALADVPGLPSNLFQKLPSTKKTIVADNTIATIFAKGAERDDKGQPKMKASLVKALLQIVTTPTVVPNFGSSDFTKAMETIANIVKFAPKKAEAQAPANDAKPVKAKSKKVA